MSAWRWPHAPTLNVLRAAYADGLSPAEMVDHLADRMEAGAAPHAFIHAVERGQLRAAAQALGERPDGRPLWGIPFTVKDCNDVPGLPTTNALPQMAYTPASTGRTIERILDAGAICIGKTNMDQFGIGLVGMRSPYGAPSCVFSEEHISGGSSSGSGTATALGLGVFSIGNDAAGSGRVPAAFNNIVGLKPTPGLVSNTAVSGGGCVKTIETMSVFALTVEDAMEITRLIAGYDPADLFSSPLADTADLEDGAPPSAFRFATPAEKHLHFAGDADAARMFDAAVERLTALGGVAVPVDFAPFHEAQAILYDGPWIAERALSLDPVLAQHGEHIHPVTRQILESAGSYSATDTFRAIHRIAELKRDTRWLWDDVDVLVVPTTPTIFTKAEIEEDPIGRNSTLGIYTNFVNLMGLCGVAVPNGFRADGVPLGVTFLAPSFCEGRAARIAKAFHRHLGGRLGASQSGVSA
ncbi:MAG: allophanate hydrolase [Pseudomonadota bacterium]